MSYAIFPSRASAILLAASIWAASLTNLQAGSLRFSVDGGAATVCADGEACDLNPLSGVIIFIGDLGGGFDVNVVTASTKPNLLSPLLNLNVINVKSAGLANTLLVEFSEIDFGNPLGSTSFVLGGVLVGGVGRTITADAYMDPGNSLFAQTQSLGHHEFGSGAFAGLDIGPGSGPGLYSLTIAVEITLPFAGDVVSYDAYINGTAVPEPATSGLAGVALIALAAAGWRKARRG